jgi:type IV pilus assembly protein PilP
MTVMEQLPTHNRAFKNTIFSWLCYAGRGVPLVRYTGIILVAIGLVACGDTPDADLRQFVSDTKAKGRSSIPPLPEPQTFEIYTYDEESLRDPFIPAKVANAANNAGSGLRPDNTRPKEVLEEFALGSLKMMGSLEKGGKLWALLKAPDGTLHRTTRGRHMGQNNGKIIKITESELELKEIVPDGLGGWIERFSTLSASE